MSQLSPDAKEMEQLRREHGKLDEKVQEFESRRWLSAQDEAEVKRLKRMKLAKKDRMRALDAQA